MGVLLLSCSLTCAAANAPIQPTSPLASLLKTEAIDSSYTISYRDEHGKAMSEAAFSASFARGRSFKLQRDTSAHSAILTLQARGHESKFSAQEDAAFHAATSGRNFLKPGAPLPAFTLETADGRRVDNAALLGHKTLVNFFFSACGPCIEETPTLTAYARKYPQQHVLAVTFDDAKTARTYIVDHHLNWPVLVDAAAFDQAMGVNAFPVMALIGADGHLLKISFSARIARKGKSLTVGDLQRWVETPPSSRR